MPRAAIAQPLNCREADPKMAGLPYTRPSVRRRQERSKTWAPLPILLVLGLHDGRNGQGDLFFSACRKKSASGFVHAHKNCIYLRAGDLFPALFFLPSSGPRGSEVGEKWWPGWWRLQPGERQKNENNVSLPGSAQTCPGVLVFLPSRRTRCNPALE